MMILRPAVAVYSKNNILCTSTAVYNPSSRRLVPGVRGAKHRRVGLPACLSLIPPLLSPCGTVTLCCLVGMH